MKKRKLKNISAHLDGIPLVKSSVLFTALAEALAQHLYELYRNTVTFSYSDDIGATYVRCDVARLFTCTRLIIDCAENEAPITVRLLLEDDMACLYISMEKACEFPAKELSTIAMLGHLRLWENDEGTYIQMEAKQERVVHLFAIDPVNLKHIFQAVDWIIDNIPEEM